MLRQSQQSLRASRKDDNIQHLLRYLLEFFCRFAQVIVLYLFQGLTQRACLFERMSPVYTKGVCDALRWGFLPLVKLLSQSFVRCFACVSAFPGSFEDQIIRIWALTSDPLSVARPAADLYALWREVGCEHRHPHSSKCKELVSRLTTGNHLDWDPTFPSSAYPTLILLTCPTMSPLCMHFLFPTCRKHSEAFYHRAMCRHLSRWKLLNRDICTG